MASWAEWAHKRHKWPFVHVLEPLEGDWQSNPSWGQSWTAPAGVVGLGAEGAVQPIGRLDRTPGPPKVYTISLLRFGGWATGTPGDFPFLRARFTVGLGGQNRVFEIDWHHGTQISLPASTISVEAVQGGTGWIPGDPLTLAVAFGQGQASRTFATYTVCPPLPPPGGAVSPPLRDQMPRYATHFQVFASTAAAVSRDPANLIMQYKIGVVPPIVVNTFADIEARTEPGIPLHPECNAIRLFNGGVIWDIASVVYRLAF